MRNRHEPRLYHNQQLIDDTNQLFVKIKKSLYLDGIKPTIKELDDIMNRIFIEFKKDYKPFRKY